MRLSAACRSYTTDMPGPPAPATASLHALMVGAVDYAGLFPPASLDLDESVRNFAVYLKSADGWMLGRFICPATRLGELLPFLPELFAGSERLPISALGRGGNNPLQFEQGLAADLEAIAAFRAAAGKSAVIDTFETRIPDPAVENAADSAQLLAQRCGEARLRPFAEVAFSGEWRAALPRIAQTLAQHHVGFKLRCGGVVADAFPTSEQIAAAILACRDAGAAVKFTAGLHHPIRHYNQAVQAKMHGFLNVFVACTLAKACQFEESRIRRVLEEEDACCFRFRDYGLSFEDSAASKEQIAAARREFATSFGSCSFDEPREDLRALRLL